MKKFPVQTIVVKAVGKGDLDNLLERLAMIFRISIPVTVFARPDTGKIGYLETEEDLLSAPDEGDALRAAEQRIGLIWLGGLPDSRMRADRKLRDCYGKAKPME